MKHSKFLAVLLALIVGLVSTLVVVGLFEMQNAELADDVVVMESQAVVGPKVPYYAFLEIEDQTASTWYVLVDLDDRTNFPHYQTNSAILKQLSYTGVLSEADHWDMRFGVVCALSDNGADVKWFHTAHRVRNTQFDASLELPEHGLNLVVDTSDEDLQFVATKEYTLTTAITTTTALESPVTESGVITTFAEVGDILMYVSEDDGAPDPGIDLSVGVAYDTD